MDDGQGEDGWKMKQEERRRRLREDFERSRRHEPPPEPDDWTPQPWWKHSWQMLWDNPLGLLVVIIALAIVLYFLFPPSALGLSLS